MNRLVFSVVGAAVAMMLLSAGYYFLFSAPHTESQKAHEDSEMKAGQRALDCKLRGDAYVTGLDARLASSTPADGYDSIIKYETHFHAGRGACLVSSEEFEDRVRGSATDILRVTDIDTGEELAQYRYPYFNPDAATRSAIDAFRAEEAELMGR